MGGIQFVNLFPLVWGYNQFPCQLLGQGGGSFKPKLGPTEQEKRPAHLYCWQPLPSSPLFSKDLHLLVQGSKCPFIINIQRKILAMDNILHLYPILVPLKLPVMSMFPSSFTQSPSPRTSWSPFVPASTYLQYQWRKFQQHFRQILATYILTMLHRCTVNVPSRHS